jgi:hypothetical protein
MKRAAEAGEASASAIGGSVVEGLVDTLRTEARLLEELASILRRQREALAVSDLEGVDECVFAAQRVLLTLGAARRRRRSLVGVIAGSEDVPVEALDGWWRGRSTPALREMAREVREAASRLSRDVALNRRVLQQVSQPPVERGHWSGRPAREAWRATMSSLPA